MRCLSASSRSAALGLTPDLCYEKIGNSQQHRHLPEERPVHVARDATCMDIDHRLRTASVNGGFRPSIHPTLIRSARPRNLAIVGKTPNFSSAFLGLDSLREPTRAD